VSSSRRRSTRAAVRALRRPSPAGAQRADASRIRAATPAHSAVAARPRSRPPGRPGSLRPSRGRRAGRRPRGVPTRRRPGPAPQWRAAVTARGRLPLHEVQDVPGPRPRSAARAERAHARRTGSAGAGFRIRSRARERVACSALRGPVRRRRTRVHPEFVGAAAERGRGRRVIRTHPRARLSAPPEVAHLAGHHERGQVRVLRVESADEGRPGRELTDPAGDLRSGDPLSSVLQPWASRPDSPAPDGIGADTGDRRGIDGAERDIPVGAYEDELAGPRRVGAARMTSAATARGVLGSDPGTSASTAVSSGRWGARRSRRRRRRAAVPGRTRSRAPPPRAAWRSRRGGGSDPHARRRRRCRRRTRCR
jgi:hypothetical protein